MIDVAKAESDSPTVICGSRAHLVCEIDGPLVNDQLLEREGHWKGRLGAF
jgi:hypothetical protein